MKKIMIALGVAFLAGCGGTGKGPDPVTEGWNAFTAGNLAAARSAFLSAYNNDPGDAEAAAGLAWALFKQDSLDRALFFFNRAAEIEVIDVPDVSAGWAFALSAAKDYSGSNTKAGLALSTDPNWQFTYGLGLNATDLRLLEAENYFSLGDFSGSLTAVQSVNASFAADVGNAEGRSQLAAEIERLRGLNKAAVIGTDP